MKNTGSAHESPVLLFHCSFFNEAINTIYLCSVAVRDAIVNLLSARRIEKKLFIPLVGSYIRYVVVWWIGLIGELVLVVEGGLALTGFSPRRQQNLDAKATLNNS